MARSNGNQDRTGAQVGQPARNAHPLDHGLPWNNTGAPAGSYPQDPQFAPQGYEPQPTGRPATPQPTAQLPWPQHAAPQLQQYAPAGYQGQPQGYTQPGYPPQSYPPQGAYPADPHHGHYFPQAAPGDQQHPYQDPAAHLRGSYPGHAEPLYAPISNPAGGHQAGGYQPAAHHAAAHDPRGYEFGAYATAPAAYPEQPGAGRGYPPQQPNPQQFDPHQAASQGADAEFDDDEEFEDEDVDPPRRFGLLKVIVSLTVAIGIGAGGAYAYKKFGTVPIGNGKPMVVRADQAPSTIRSAEASLADSKSGERVGEQVPAVVPAGDSPADGSAPAGARRVQTIAIAPPGAQASSQPPMRPTISVPGLALDGMGMGQPQAAAMPPVTPAPAGRTVAPPPAVQRAPIAPKVIASVEDPASAPPPRAPVAKAPPKAAKSSDAYSPGGSPSAIGGPAPTGGVTVASAATTAAAAAAPPAAPAKVAANGYIAVLSSQTSAIAARKTLDDLQIKFSDVLGGKPTDVTEFANPKDGKTYYRAIVGPPGSREAAASVCTQVKAAGYKDCFAAAY